MCYPARIFSEAFSDKRYAITVGAQNEEVFVERVRVVLPVFNGEKYLEYAINSVLIQTYQNFEVLIADDGSTDSTAKITEKYASKDDRIKHLKLPHGGVSSARNAAIEAAGSFAYVAFIDADDRWDADHLAIGVSVLSRFSEADVYFSGIRVDASESAWDEDRVSEYESIVSSPSRDFDECVDNETYLISGPRCRKALLLGTLWIMPSTVIMRKNSVSRSQWFRTDLAVSEDTELFLEIARQNKTFIFDKTPRVIYRRHSENASASPDVLGKKSGAALIAALRFSKIRLSVCDTPDELMRVSRQASEFSYLVALNYLARHERRIARKYFIESLHFKIGWKAIKGIVATVLPEIIVRKIQNWRGS